METFKLETQERTDFGTKNAKTLRKAGHYPATLVGEGGETVHFAIPAEEFDAAVRRNARRFELHLPNGESAKAAVQEAMFDSMGDQLLQIDFIRDTSGDLAIARARKFGDKGYED